MKVIRLEERLPKPDFKGEWKNFNEISGKFNLYVLKRYPYQGNLDRDMFGRVGTTVEVIEGVTTDALGLAIFSGHIGNVGIEFHKNYSKLAEGAINNLFYYGYAAKAVGCSKEDLDRMKMGIHLTPNIPNSPYDVSRYEGNYKATDRKLEEDIGTFWMEKVE